MLPVGHGGRDADARERGVAGDRGVRALVPGGVVRGLEDGPVLVDEVPMEPRLAAHRGLGVGAPCVLRDVDGDGLGEEHGRRGPPLARESPETLRSREEHHEGVAVPDGESEYVHAPQPRVEERPGQGSPPHREVRAHGIAGEEPGADTGQARKLRQGPVLTDTVLVHVDVDPLAEALLGFPYRQETGHGPLLVGLGAPPPPYPSMVPAPVARFPERADPSHGGSPQVEVGPDVRPSNGVPAEGVQVREERPPAALAHPWKERREDGEGQVPPGTVDVEDGGRSGDGPRTRRPPPPPPRSRGSPALRTGWDVESQHLVGILSCHVQAEAEVHGRGIEGLPRLRREPRLHPEEPSRRESRGGRPARLDRQVVDPELRRIETAGLPRGLRREEEESEGQDRRKAEPEPHGSSLLGG